MGYLSTDKQKVTTKVFREMKQLGQKIAMLTAYDFTTAGILDRAGIDAILVGDSSSNVMAGNATTLPITVDEMIVYARGVVRACSHCLVVCDMPFGSYQVSREDALCNAVRIMKETGADAIKMEGGSEILPTVQAIIQAGIPVMAHLDLRRKAFINLAVMDSARKKRRRQRSYSRTLVYWMKPAALA